MLKTVIFYVLSENIFINPQSIRFLIHNVFTYLTEIWHHVSQSGNGITGRHLFRTCRNATMAIQCLELLYVALIA